MNKDRITGAIKFQTKHLCSFHPAVPVLPLFFICMITQARNLGPPVKFTSLFLSVLLATASGQTSTLFHHCDGGRILLSGPPLSSTIQPSSELLLGLFINRALLSHSSA